VCIDVIEIADTIRQERPKDCKAVIEREREREERERRDVPTSKNNASVTSRPKRRIIRVPIQLIAPDFLFLTIQYSEYDVIVFFEVSERDINRECTKQRKQRADRYSVRMKKFCSVKNT
jgi:hypothetical protein